MARKRSIKPEFFEDEAIAKLSSWARLLYIGLWCHMDGNGVVEGNPKLINAKVFPLDDLEIEKLVSFLNELIAIGLVRAFDFEGKRYLYCPTFKDHQKLYADDKKLPIPEKVLETALNDTSWKREETSLFRASPSPSSSHSALASNSISTSSSGLHQAKKTRTPRQAEPSAPTPVTRVRDAFLESFKKEFKRDYPGWGAKENGQTANWLKSVSVEKAIQLCELYPKWNKPWHVDQGHAFSYLISDYVKLDAWANSSKQLIAKIAAGKAAENVDLKRAVDFQEMKRGLEHTVRQQEAQSPSRTGHLQKQLPLTAEERILAEYGDSFGAEVLDPSSESDSA